MILAASLAVAAPLEPLRTGVAAPEDAAVVIGLEDYAFVPDVPYAHADAQAVYDTLVYTVGVPPERVTLLKAAAREQILAAVQRAGELVGPGGRVWVYFSGHGAADPATGERLLLGDDARPDPVAFAARGVGLPELEALAVAHGGTPLVLVDACYTGVGRDGASLLGGARPLVPTWAWSPPSGAVWTAAGPAELAGPLPDVEHGAFTWFVVGALRGWADGEVTGQRDGRVDSDEATAYVARSLAAAQVTAQTPSWTGPAVLGLSSGTELGPPVGPPAASAAPSPQAAPAPARARRPLPTVPTHGRLVFDAAATFGGTPAVDASTGLRVQPLLDGGALETDREFELDGGGGFGAALGLALRAEDLVEIPVVAEIRTSQVDADFACDSQTPSIRGCVDEHTTVPTFAFGGAVRGRLPWWPRLYGEAGGGVTSRPAVAARAADITVTNDSDEAVGSLAPGESIQATASTDAVRGAWLPTVRLGVGVDLSWAAPLGLYSALSLEVVPDPSTGLPGNGNQRLDNSASLGGRADTDTFLRWSVGARFGAGGGG